MENKLLSWEEIYDKLNIKKMIGKIESAEDPTIPFSKFDTCYVSGIEFNSGEQHLNRSYNRKASNFFQNIFKLLKENWGYEVDMEYYDKKRAFLNNDFIFVNSDRDLPKVTVDFNKYHENQFRFRIGYEIISNWIDISKTNNINIEIINHLKKNDNIRLLRDLKLRQLINEI